MLFFPYSKFFLFINW